MSTQRTAVLLVLILVLAVSSAPVPYAPSETAGALCAGRLPLFNAAILRAAKTHHPVDPSHCG